MQAGAGRGGGGTQVRSRFAGAPGTLIIIGGRGSAEGRPDAHLRRLVPELPANQAPLPGRRVSAGMRARPSPSARRRRAFSACLYSIDGCWGPLQAGLGEGVAVAAELLPGGNDRRCVAVGRKRPAWW
eukprot:jgi/Mesvir1/11102/Mv24183-RA.1